MKEVIKYQLTCPKCKYEFEYDGGKIDAEIERLKYEISSIQEWIQDYNLKSRYSKEKLCRERQFKGKELEQKKMQLTALKSRRKAANQFINLTKEKIFLQLVKDEIGEECYKKLMEKAEKELEAYQISGLMWHEYTNNKSGVISINKL